MRGHDVKRERKFFLRLCERHYKFLCLGYFSFSHFLFTAFLAKKFGPQVVFLFFFQVRRTNEGVEINLPCVSFYQSDMHQLANFCVSSRSLSCGFVSSARERMRVSMNVVLFPLVHF